MAEHEASPGSEPTWRTEQRILAANVNSARSTLLAQATEGGGLVYGVVNAYTHHNRSTGGLRVRIRSHVDLLNVRRALEIKEPADDGATMKRRFELVDKELDEDGSCTLAEAERAVVLALHQSEIGLPVSIPTSPVSGRWNGGRLQVVAIVAYLRTSLWWDAEVRITVDELLAPAELAGGPAIIEVKGQPIAGLSELVGGQPLDGGKWELLNRVRR